MKRPATERINKYTKKIDAGVIGSRYDATKKLSVDQQKEYFAKAEKLEEQVKLIIDGEPSFLHHFYIAFAEELSTKTTEQEKFIVYLKWSTRGLKNNKIWKISSSIFGFDPILWYAKSLGNLVGYWNFDEGKGTTVNDLSGYKNNGTSLTFPTWTDGLISKALLYDGVNDSVNVQNSASLSFTNQISVSVWFKCTGAAVHDLQRLFVKIGVAYTQAWYAYTAKKVAFEVKNDAGVGKSVASSNTGEYNQWHHVVSTWDGTTMKVYFNKILSSELQGGLITNANDYLFIGNIGSGGGRPFKGLLDNIMIFKKVLSFEEIKKINAITKP